MRGQDDPAVMPYRPPGDAPLRDDGTVPANSCDAEVAALFRAHSQRLASYLVNLDVDLEMAADIVQDSFMVTRFRWQELHRDRNRVVYLYKAATDRMRRLRHRPGRPPAEPGGHAGQSTAAHSGLPASPERDAPFSALPRRQREVILLSSFYGFTDAEIADILCISEGHAESYLPLGERRLAESFQAELGIAAEDSP